MLVMKRSLMRVFALALWLGCSSEPGPPPTDVPSEQDDRGGSREDASSGDSPIAGCDVQAVFERNACTGCHDATPELAGGGLDLVSTGVAARVVSIPSRAAGCDDDVIVNLEDPGASTLLRSIAPDDYSSFGSAGCNPERMPLASASRVPRSDVECVERWIASLDVPGEPADPPVPGDPLTVASKIKTLVHGGALTSDELARLMGQGGSIDRDGLRALVESWLQTEEWRTKRRRFLTLTLQQNPSNPNYFAQYRNTQTHSQRFLRQSLRESIVRTAERLIDDGEDFRTISTTNTWEVTTSVLWALKMADNPMFLKPNGVWPKGNVNNDMAQLNRRGAFDQRDTRDWRTVTLLHDTGSTHMYTGEGLDDPTFLDFDANLLSYSAELRAVPDGGAVTLRAPRLGFFTSPAFFQTWETNVDNEFRVTLNQAMIVATGRAFSAGDSTPRNTDLAAVDLEVFPQGSECLGCHKNIEPMRIALLQSYDPINSRYTIPEEAAPPYYTYGAPLPAPDFAFQGHSVAISSLHDFADALATHPNAARAWTLKLCQWATSVDCDRNHPEVARVAASFEASGFDMNQLFAEFFSSRLVTDTSFLEDTSVPGAQVTIARRGHFCHAMDVRLAGVLSSRGVDTGVDPFCGTDDASVLASSIPDDAFVRGTPLLHQPRELDPFSSIAFEGLCALKGAELVGTRSRDVFDARDPDLVLDHLVSHILGFPMGTPRFTSQRALLQRLYDAQVHPTSCADPAALAEALAEDEVTCGMGLGATEALQNVWSIVCQSPRLTGLGL